MGLVKMPELNNMLGSFRRISNANSQHVKGTCQRGWYTLLVVTPLGLVYICSDLLHKSQEGTHKGTCFMGHLVTL